MSLTPEGRRKISEGYKARKQWELANGTHTGPKTEEGRRASAMRSLKHGGRSAGVIALESWLASVRRLTKL